MKTEKEIRMILSACMATHGIDTQEGVNGIVYAKDVGFINKCKEFTAGTAKMDACYVGETTDNVILAFRGTSTDFKDTPIRVIADWLNDFLAKPIEIEGIPGQLHEGFTSSVERLWDKGFSQEVQERIKGGKNLIVTGYSKGAALAPIAAIFLKEKLNINPKNMFVCVFEAPRPGNPKFARYFNGVFPDTLRYAYQDDLVPHLPPVRIVSRLISEIPWIGEILEKYDDIDDWNYKSVGNLKYVDWDNNIVDGSAKITVERISHLIKLTLKGDFLDSIKEHMPCGHIYNVIMGKDCPKVEKTQLKAMAEK
jgi:hypothetical protein